MIAPKDIKKLIQARIKKSLPQMDVLTEIGKDENYIQPSGKIIIMYDGSDPIDKDILQGQFMDRTMNFDVHIVVKDLVQNDKLLDTIESVMSNIIGFMPDQLFTNECIKYRGDQFTEFDREEGLFSHKIRFSFKQSERYYMGN